MHTRQATWNFQCSESIQTKATALAGSLAKIQLRSIGFPRTPVAGGAVLNKCANPVCNAQFRYFHQGKLFEVEIQYAESPPSGGQTKAVNGKGHSDRCWLCDDCAAHITLRFDARRGEVIVSSLRSSEEELATPLLGLNGAAGARIARVLIRPLELAVTTSTRRKAVRELDMRRREAA